MYLSTVACSSLAAESAAASTRSASSSTLKISHSARRTISRPPLQERLSKNPVPVALTTPIRKKPRPASATAALSTFANPTINHPCRNASPSNCCRPSTIQVTSSCIGCPPKHSRLIEGSPMRSFAFRSLAIIAVAALFISDASAQEWTRFRGPNGTGESETTTIPSSWTDKDLNWKIDLPGIGHSSPVLWGEKIFILSADPKTAARYVLCINSKDGKQIWRRDYPGVPHHLHVNSSFASVTPAVDGERIFVAWSDPDFTR